MDPSFRSELVHCSLDPFKLVRTRVSSLNDDDSNDHRADMSGPYAT